MAEEEKVKEETTEAPVEAEKIEVKKDVLTSIPTEETVKAPKPRSSVDDWMPKSSIGRKVKNGEIKHIDEILDQGIQISEAEIVETLMPNIKTELLMIGQSKGKFGGGQKRVFKQTQKKTTEGNKPSFATISVAGSGNGYVGVGKGKSKDTVPAREKSFRRAKLNVFKITRGCGSWGCNCHTPHSIPFEVEGKCGSARIKLIPAPKGKGLCILPECAKILALAGIKDVWSKTRGKTTVKTNVIMACVDALKKLSKTKVLARDIQNLGLHEGGITNE